MKCWPRWKAAPVHELAVCQELVEQATGVARRHGAVSLQGVWVRIGPLSGVEGELLQRAWPFACAGTLAEGAALHVEAAPVEVVCRGCGAHSEARANRLVCGVCGDWQTDLASGDEMLLTRVEMDCG